MIIDPDVLSLIISDTGIRTGRLTARIKVST